MLTDIAKWVADFLGTTLYLLADLASRLFSDGEGKMADALP